MTASEYLRRVAYELRDLPWRQRRDLVSELEGHLAELPPATDFRARLGAPEQYAADMRAAAGLERRRGPIAFIQAQRPRNLIATVVALTVIGLAIGAVAWIDSYQPLSLGDGFRYPAGKELTGLQGELTTFRRGAPFNFGVQIVNGGQFSVRILGVPYEESLPWKVRLMMSRPMTNHLGGMEGPYTRFQPFDLPPGDVVFLFFKGVYACKGPESPHSSVVLVDFPIRYRFLWRTTTFQMPLPENLAINFPKGCPGPPPP